MLTTADTGGSSVVSVIIDALTTASRTFTVRPARSSSDSWPATRVRNRVHHCSSALVERSVTMTFSTR